MKNRRFVKISVVSLMGLVMCMLVQGMLWEGRNTVSVTNTEINVKQTEKKVAYITFDDGPSELTSQYLDVLKKEGVRATFFLIGQQVEGDKINLVKREIKEGHEIGLHTYCHEADQIYSSKDAYLSDLNKVFCCLKKKCGIKPAFFRFPWGSANAYVSSYKKEVISEMKSKGLEYVDWNVSGEDSVGCPSVQSILDNVRKDYEKYNEPVILLHDSGSCGETLKALPIIIKELKAKGYSFDTIAHRKKSCHFGEYN